MEGNKTQTGTLKMMVIGALVPMDISNVFENKHPDIVTMLDTSEADIRTDDNDSIQIIGIHQNIYRIKRYWHILTMNIKVNPKEGAEPEAK
jgi:hypothetical protein